MTPQESKFLAIYLVVVYGTGVGFLPGYLLAKKFLTRRKK